MTTDTHVEAVQPGYEYTVYFGCDLDEDGNANWVTAERIVGGWAATRQQISAQIAATLRRYDDD